MQAEDILVIENSPETMSLVKRVLTPRGFFVDVASSRGDRLTVIKAIPARGDDYLVEPIVAARSQASFVVGAICRRNRGYSSEDLRSGYKRVVRGR